MTYLTLLIYPLVAMFTPEPSQFRWWIRTGGLPMPADVLEKSERNEAMLLIVKFVLVIGATYALARYASLPLNSVGFRLNQPYGAILAGLLAASLLIGWASRMQKLAQRLGPDTGEAQPIFLRQPTWKIFVIIVVGGFAEEFWRAISLTVFEKNHHSPTEAVLLTSIVFGIGHAQSPQNLPKTLGRILRPALAGALFAGLFLFSKSLVVPFLVHIMTNSFAALMGRKKLVGRLTPC